MTGAASALYETANGMVSSAAGIFLDPHKELKATRAKNAGEGSSSNPAAAMTLASAKNVGKFHSSLFKGTMVDMPLAITEGLLAVPRLYGEKTAEHAPIVDWKSGAAVAGKASYPYKPCINRLTNLTSSHSPRNFTAVSPASCYSHITALVRVVQLASLRAWGKVHSGYQRGQAQVFQSPPFVAPRPLTDGSTAVMGLVAYPGQGICKSLYTLTHARTRKAITAARHAEGQYLMQTEWGRSIDASTVLRPFETATRLAGLSKQPSNTSVPSISPQ